MDIVLLCINGGVAVVSGVMGPTFPLHTPFNSSLNVTATATPSIYNGNNSTTGLVSQVTTNVVNATNAGGTGGIVLAISNSFFFALNIVWAFIQFITGGFAFSVLAIFGFPTIFVYTMQGIIGILLVRSIIYYTTGR